MIPISPYLNHTNLDDLKAHQNRMPEWLAEAFQTKLNMIEYHPQRFARANQYHTEMVGLLLMGDYTLKRRFLMCCADGRPCGLVKWCAFCAYVRKMKLMRGFLTKFHRARFWFLTISIPDFLSFMPGDSLATEVYWDAAVSAVKQLREDGIAQGVWWSEELHIQSLLPPLVKPHVHFLIAADDIDIGALSDLRERVLAYRAPSCEQFRPQNLPDRLYQVTQPVTTRTYELRTEIDLANVLGYMIKPVNLPESYLAAWPVAEANNRAGAPWLNQAVDYVLEGFELNVGAPFWFDRWNPAADGKRKRRRPCRHQFGYVGSMHSRHRDFVGTKAEKRDTLSQKELVKTLLKDQAVEKTLGLWQPQWLGRSVEETATAEE
jgi:hypothetical protein